LRRRNIGEADRLYSILTYGKGKVTAKARGVRRVTSKQSGHLEPFYLTSFHLVGTKGTDIITSAVVEESFPGIHSDLTKIGLASRFAELTDTLTEDHQPVPGVFELLSQALTIIEQSRIRELTSLFPQIFDLKLMAELGYQPELYGCVVGEEKYSSLQAYQFSISLGGLVCSDHQEKHPGIPVSQETIHALKKIIEQPLGDLIQLKINQRTWREIDEISRRFLEYHLDPKLKSPKVSKDLQT
jgi:DNA repair protein RecO (recombination protein O)